MSSRATLAVLLAVLGGAVVSHVALRESPTAPGRPSIPSSPAQGSTSPSPWEAALLRILASEEYGHAKVSPTDDLLPLGPDPKTKLEEFLHLPSHKGAVPVRDEAGRLRCEIDTGLVFVLLPPRDGHMLLFSRFEMDQAQWLRLAPGTENPSKDAPPHAKSELGGERIDLTHPVENVPYLQAHDLLVKYRLRLPTEAEWIYACRAGTTTRWSTGDEPSSLKGSANVFDRTVVARIGERWTSTGLKTLIVPENHPVNFEDGFVLHTSVFSLLPNRFGLHQMHGNVAEWCDGHLGKGGAFDMGSEHAEVSASRVVGEGYKDDHLGVRPVKDIGG